ncbi:MAG: GTPase Era [Pseudomonadota bacterium]
MTTTHRSGYVALVGRPNVGKSTLLNRLTGQKLAITSHKPQTTRHQILGICSTDQAQVVYIDTPGIHRSRGKALSHYLNQTAQTALHDVNLIVFVCQARQWQDEDELVLNRIRASRQPCIAVVNKIDRVPDKAVLLPFLQQLADRHTFAAILPVSARSGKQVDTLAAAIEQQLPQCEPLFPSDQITDRSERFFAAELLREQITRRYHQELPYATSVEIEQFVAEPNRYRIHAIIWVERDSQRAILLGKQGQALKATATAARQQMCRFFDTRVHLQVWIKVRNSWSDDENSLAQLGYTS